MPKFRVTVGRTATCFDRTVIEVEADDPEQAEEKAYEPEYLSEADWHNVYDETQQYDVTKVEEVQDG